MVGWDWQKIDKINKANFDDSCISNKEFKLYPVGNQWGMNRPNLCFKKKILLAQWRLN